jgi:hypothetical protein
MKSMQKISPVWCEWANFIMKIISIQVFMTVSLQIAIHENLSTTEKIALPRMHLIAVIPT